jgi:internalin A
VSGLAGLPALTQIDLRSNALVDVGPLGSIATLQTVNVELNQVQDVAPLADLAAITQLSVDTNLVDDIADFAARFDCTNHPTVSFTDNPLDAADCADVASLADAGCTVWVDPDLGC